MVSDFGSTFLAVGPVIIIIIGVVLTIVLAGIWQGTKRWIVLICGPGATSLVTIVSTYLALKVIHSAEGSGFLLGGTVTIVFAVLLVLYYPVLAVVWLIGRSKARKAAIRERNSAASR